MRIINMGIDKELFDKIDAMAHKALQYTNHFWYKAPFTKQSIITILYLANMWSADGYHAWIDCETITIERWKA